MLSETCSILIRDLNKAEKLPIHIFPYGAITKNREGADMNELFDRDVGLDETVDDRRLGDDGPILDDATLAHPLSSGESDRLALLEMNFADLNRMVFASPSPKSSSANRHRQC